MTEPLPQPTKRHLHGYKYSPKELAEKEHYIKQMMRDWPDTPGGELMCEWVYDFVKQHTQEELDHIMETGKFDMPSKFSPEANTKMIAEYEKNGAHHIES